MSTTADRPQKPQQPLSSLEADLAYFDARLALIGTTPSTIHEAAQIKAYTTLAKVLRQAIERRRATKKSRS